MLPARQMSEQGARGSAGKRPALRGCALGGGGLPLLCRFSYISKPPLSDPPPPRHKDLREIAVMNFAGEIRG